MKINARRLSYSVLSGVMAFLSFPKWNFSFLAWFAILPLYRAVDGLGFWNSFLCGWIAGLTAFCGILYWIVPTFHAAGVSIAIGLLALTLLAGYVALYHGFFAALFERYLRSFGPAGYFFLAPALWVSLELFRGRLFTGFPWGLIGYSQRPNAMSSVCVVTGIYGISFILIFVNGLGYELLRAKRFALCSLLLASLASASYFGPSRSRSGQNEDTAGQFQVTLLQGNVNQYKKWSPDYVQEILGIYGSLSRESMAEGDAAHNPRLIVWPETALPGWYPQEQWLSDWLRSTLEKNRQYHLIGSVTNESGHSYNSAFLFGPDGKTAGRYDKMHLVPFGEFVPMQRILGKWIPVLNQLGGFDRGADTRVLRMGKYNLGVTICYEAIFPELVRRQVLEGAETLVNITNDGWYLDTAAPEQHFAMSVYRAIENGRYLARCANTGISGVVHPSGLILRSTALNSRSLLTERVSAIRDMTFYTRYGDLFAWLCAVISAGFIIIASLRRKKNENTK